MVVGKDFSEEKVEPIIWTLTNHSPSPEFPGVYVGNGFMGLQVSPWGFGAIRDLTESKFVHQQVNGFWALDFRGTEARAEPPAWSRLALSHDGGRYGAIPVPLRSVQILRGSEVLEAQGVDIQLMAEGGDFSARSVPGARRGKITWAVSPGLSGTCLVRIRYRLDRGTFTTFGYQTDMATPQSLTVGTSDSRLWQTVVATVELPDGGGRFSLEWMNPVPLLLTIDEIAIAAVGRRPAASEEMVIEGGLTDYEQSLDLRGGMVATGAVWTTPDGRSTRISSELWVHRTREGLAVLRLMVIPEWSGLLTLSDESDGCYAKFVSQWQSGESVGGEELWQLSRAQGTNLVAAAVSRTAVEPWPSGLEGGRWVVDQGRPRLAWTVQAGTRYMITRYCGMAVDADEHAALERARRQGREAGMLGYEALAAEHRKAWDHLWDSRIEVSGTRSEALASASQYYLLSSTSAENEWSVASTGLAADGWGGRIFWDAETWIYPVLLLTHPAWAAGMNRYRARQIEAYREYARDSGGLGARVCWEAGMTGKEQGLEPYGLYELHVTASVALAQWQYFVATGDGAWWRSEGWPVLRDLADWLASRAVHQPDGTYDIPDVMGPDEYHWPVRYDAYTNGTAKMVLETARRAAEALKEPANPQWDTVATGLVVLIDPDKDMHRQYAGYAGETIKQADVVLLRYPWQYVTDPQRAENDLRYYASKVDPKGPAMADSIHAIVAASIPGCERDANLFLDRAARGFVRPPYWQWAETTSPDGVRVFLTGACGWLQALVYGVLGFRWRDDCIFFDPVALHSGDMEAITVHHLHWRGRTITARLSERKFTVRLDTGPDAILQMGDTRQVLSLGKPVQGYARALQE